MMDNITVDDSGHVMLQEDVGGQYLSGRVWESTIATGAYRVVARHDIRRFGSDLGGRTYLLDAQAHYPHPDTGLVEGGQLLVMRMRTDD